MLTGDCRHLWLPPFRPICPLYKTPLFVAVVKIWFGPCCSPSWPSSLFLPGNSSPLPSSFCLYLTTACCNSLWSCWSPLLLFLLYLLWTLLLFIIYVTSEWRMVITQYVVLVHTSNIMPLNLPPTALTSLRRPLKLAPLMIEEQRDVVDCLDDFLFSWKKYLRSIAREYYWLLSFILMAIRLIWLRCSTRMVAERGPLLDGRY